jgi:hypothetical protein
MIAYSVFYEVLGTVYLVMIVRSMLKCDFNHYMLFCHSRHFLASPGTSASSKVIRPCGIEHAKHAIRRFLKCLGLVIGVRLVGRMMSNALSGKILN